MQFNELALLLSKIRNTPSTNDKIKLFEEFISDLNSEETEIIYQLLLDDSPLKRRANYSHRSFIRVYPECIDFEYDSIEPADLLSGKTDLEPVFVAEVYNIIQKIAQIKGKASVKKKDQLLSLLIFKLTKREWYWFYHIMTGLKIGFSNLLLNRIIKSSFNQKAPLGVMLAKSSKISEITDELVRSSMVEKKLDGIRLLLKVEKGLVVSTTTRNKRDITDRMAPYFAGCIDSTFSGVIDGELWTPGGFQLLSTIIMRIHTENSTKIADLTYTAFDVIEFESVSLVDLPYTERRAKLESIRMSSSDLLRIEIVESIKLNSIDEVESLLYNEYRDEEGVILKRLEGRYEPGKRSQNWLKIKKNFETLDVAILSVARGHGARSNWFGAYNAFVIEKNSGELKCIAAVGSGFNEATLESFTKRILEAEGINSIPTEVLELSNPLIFEIKYQSFQDNKMSDPFKHRLSCRFPIFVRERWDKDITEISIL